MIRSQLILSVLGAEAAEPSATAQLDKLDSSLLLHEGAPVVRPKAGTQVQFPRLLQVQINITADMFHVLGPQVIPGHNHNTPHLIVFPLPVPPLFPMPVLLSLPLSLLSQLPVQVKALSLLYLNLSLKHPLHLALHMKPTCSRS